MADVETPIIDRHSGTGLEVLAARFTARFAERIYRHLRKMVKTDDDINAIIAKQWPQTMNWKLTGKFAWKSCLPIQILALLPATHRSGHPFHLSSKITLRSILAKNLALTGTRGCSPLLAHPQRPKALLRGPRVPNPPLQLDPSIHTCN